MQMEQLKAIDFSGRNALIVDNDPDFAADMKSHLLALGFRADTASSLAEALELANKKQFDLVVTEILLEHQDSGFLLCYEIRKQSPDTRIVIVSGISFRTGIHFDLSSADAKTWIKADSILDKEIRFEQFDHELLRLFRQGE